MDLIDSPQVTGRMPNGWLKPLLALPPLRHHWFAPLAYTKMAEHFGNSSLGTFGPSPCWYISLGDTADIGKPAFKGFFLTQKGSLGFLNQGHLARFYNGVAFVGNDHAALEGIGIDLVGIALDPEQNVIFVVSHGYRRRFGVPAAALASVFTTLKQFGAILSSPEELLSSDDPVETLWTVPAKQIDANNLQAIETVRHFNLN
jgi:hypothetical protein